MAVNETDQTEVLSPEATQEQSGCEHHWVLPAPNGPLSKGVCRSCGEERDFPNYIHGGWASRGGRPRSAPTG